MSFPSTELVKIKETYTDLEMIVKNEVQVDDKFEILDDYAEKSKCGEIFTLRDGNFILICGFCHIDFENMRLFGEHVRGSHHDEVFQLQFHSLTTAPNPIAINAPIVAKMELNISADEFSEESAPYQYEEEEEESSARSTSDSEDDSNQTKRPARISCDGCKRSYSSRKSLRQHQSKSGCKQNVSTKSIGGNQPAKPKTQLKDDGSKEAKTKNTSLFCDLCNQSFNSKYDFHCHANQLHNTVLPLILQNDPEFLKCNVCHEQLSNLSEKIEHENIHAGKPPHSCPHCPKIYALSTDLAEHLKRHLKKRDHSCEICGKAFMTKKVLRIHMARHTGDRPFACEDCGLTFPVQSQLNFHRKRHTEQKDYRCDVCQKAFYSSAMLKDHRIGHTNEQPFVCDVCGRRFSRAGAHKKHMKLHSGVKDYVCNICGKAYAQDSGLYSHKKTHLK